MEIIISIAIFVIIVTIGIFAILKIDKSKKAPENNLGVGIGMGMLLGLIYGITINNIALGVAIGAGVGIAIGSAIPAIKNKETAKRIAITGLISLIVAVSIIFLLVLIQ